MLSSNEALKELIIYINMNTEQSSKHKTFVGPYGICRPTMLDERRRRWADIVQMLYKCFAFAGRAYLHMSPL